MAAYPILTSKELAEYSGRPDQSYSKYATQALLQATLLFKIGTCLHALPEDETQQELAKLAILAMADSIFLSQAYQQAAASPFSSETIGSYSYTKAAATVAKGGVTGVQWFDIAIQQMSVCGSFGTSTSGIQGGGIYAFTDEHRMDVSIPGSTYTQFLSSSERVQSMEYGWDPNRVISRN